MLCLLDGSFDKVSAVIKVCRNLAALTATTWQCLEYHTGLFIYHYVTQTTYVHFSPDMPRRFSEGICAAIDRCVDAWIVCRSMQCECDRAGIRVHLRWKTIRSSSEKCKVRKYSYHYYMLFNLIRANVIS